MRPYRPRFGTVRTIWRDLDGYDTRVTRLRAWSGITGWRFESSSAHDAKAPHGGAFVVSGSVPAELLGHIRGNTPGQVRCSMVRSPRDRADTKAPLRPPPRLRLRRPSGGSCSQTGTPRVRGQGRLARRASEVDLAQPRPRFVAGGVQRGVHFRRRQARCWDERVQQRLGSTSARRGVDLAARQVGDHVLVAHLVVVERRRASREW